MPSTPITRAVILAEITPVWQKVTRLPDRLRETSTRPSMYKDSEPVTSPLMTSDLPIVAWSAVVVVAGRGAAGGSCDDIGGALGVEMVGRSGSVGRVGVVLG